MKTLLEMLFPKLMFCIDGDPNTGGDPNGQPAGADAGNGDDATGDPAATTPTDFVEFQSTKISKADFEAKAKELYKDAFDAHANREKWQAENTRKAQEIKQIQRDAEAFRRLQSDPRYQQAFGPQQPTSQKQGYVQRMAQKYPDVDPHFFEDQFDSFSEIAGLRAKEAISPFAERNAQEWEKNFLASHPIIKPGTEKYSELAELLEANPGIDPEKAYKMVYQDELINQQLEDRIKARDEEAKRKLKMKSPTSTPGQRPKSEDEAFESAWAKYGN